MKLSSALKAVAIVAYFIIFIKGTLVSLPFLLYLLFTVVNGTTAQQVTAVVALVGLLYYFGHPIYRNRRNKFITDVLVFACLLAPLLERLLNVGIEVLDFRPFLLPAAVFTGFFLFALVLLALEVFRGQAQPVIDAQPGVEPVDD